MAQLATGKSNREGNSLIELFSMFPDNDTAESWLEKQRWGELGKPSHCPVYGDTEQQIIKPSLMSLPC